MRIRSPIIADSPPPLLSLFPEHQVQLRKLQHYYVVGSRVHCRLIGSGDGIVFAIHGEQRPETVRFQGIAVMGGNAEFDVVFANGSNGHISPKVPEAIVRCEQWDLLPGVASAEEIAAALRHVEAVREKKASTAAHQAASLEQRRLALIAEHGHWLKPLAANTRDRVVHGAANLRRELSRHFPEARFSVRSRGGAMFSTITVTWHGGPAPADVRNVASKYAMKRWAPEQQDFVPITENAWAAAFGGADSVSFSHYGAVPAGTAATA